jgi:hypothetical protein
MWVAVFTLVWQSSGSISEMVHKWLSKENAKDIWDLAVWLIPVVWWINDLYIAASGKDWNNRDLTKKERYIRTWFGIVWLIPWGWLLLKWWAKLVKWAAWVRAIKAADVWLESFKLAWKAWTYGYLWYTLAESVVTTSVSLLKWHK